MACTTGEDPLEADPNPHAVKVSTKEMVEDAKDDDTPFRFPTGNAPDQPPPTP